MASPPIGLRAPLFLASWVVMMVAMMFPTAMPMILTFHNVQAVKYQLDDAFVSTWVFVGAYLLVWALAGIAAYAGVLAAETAAARAALTPAAEAQVGGVILLIAGLYQLTPLKELCLSKCRTPIRFIMTSWRDGTAGAFRMGLLPRNLLSGLLLASFRHSLSARHECWSDGSCHSHHIGRENAALAPAHASRRGCRACALRCAGDCVIPTPPHRQERWQRGYARRNADDDARGWQRSSMK